MGQWGRHFRAPLTNPKLGDCVAAQRDIRCLMFEQRQPHARERVIVGRYPAMPLDTATQADVNEHLLAVAPEIGAVWRHEAATQTLSIARRLLVDMLRVETKRAMIAMPPATQRRTHKRPAMTALELFRFRLFDGRRSIRLAPRCNCRAAANDLESFNIVEGRKILVSYSWQLDSLQQTGTTVRCVRSRAG
jgi:hypothetical protein